VGLGRFAIVFDEVIVHFLHGSLMADLLGRGTAQVLVEDIGISDNLAFRIRLTIEDVGKRLSRGRCLLAYMRLRFLLLVGFALFLLACVIVSPLSRLRTFDRLTHH
jgi:hypothetical protein